MLAEVLVKLLVKVLAAAAILSKTYWWKYHFLASLFHEVSVSILAIFSKSLVNNPAEVRTKVHNYAIYTYI